MAIASNYPNLRPSLLLDFAEGQQLDPRVTFSRSTTAPYYDGKTSALAEQNFFIQSNTFNNAAWVATSATIASGVTAPDGTATAYSMTATAGNATLYQTVTLTATPYTESIWIQRVTGTGTINLTLDGTTLSPVTITGAWAKYAYTATPTAGAKTIGIQIVTSGDAINIYGSQLENRSSATATNITTTTALTNYIPQLLTAPINAPRFDFNPTTGESLGLLIEQSSTNLLTYSQDFSNAAWNWNGGVTLTSVANIAPDGTQTAYQMKIDTSTGLHRVAKSLTVVVGQSYNSSFYVKAGTATKIGILPVNGAQPYNYTNTTIVVFDLAVGNVNYVGASSNSVLANCLLTSVGNGWYRISVGSTNAPFTSAAFSIIMIDQTTPTNYSFTGNGTDYFYIWGAQLEALSFPTSYIATTSAQVTRAADPPAKMLGSYFTGWFNYQQGTIYCSFDTPTVSASAPNMAIWGIDNGTTGQYYVNKSTATLSGYEGTNNASFGTITANTNQQSIYAYSNVSGSQSASGLLNGGSIGAITATTQSILPTQLTIGGYTTTNNQFTGHIKKIAYYPQALTSAQLQSITGS